MGRELSFSKYQATNPTFEAEDETPEKKAKKLGFDNSISLVFL